MYGYIYYYDDLGNYCALNQHTGEITEAVMTSVPVGSRIRTPEQTKAYIDKVKKEEAEYLRRKEMGELGNFFFLMCREFDDLSVSTAARLFYLCTYLNYENEFMLSQRTHMKKSDLQRVLGVSKRTAYDFFNEVSEKYIIEDSEGLKLASSDIIKGKLGFPGKSYIKCFNDSIRKVYRSLEPSKHRYLGYVFMILPFINTEYNILCWNPTETEYEDIEGMTIAEFCEIVGYSPKKYKTLMKIYSEITFKFKGHEEYFLSFAFNPKLKLEESRIFVNPRILYSGSDIRKVLSNGFFRVES